MVNKEPKIDKRKLKKHPKYGYFIIKGGLIHYYDNNKKYENTKIY